MNVHYERLLEDRGLDWFLETVIVRDILSVINAGAGYLAFSLIAQAIEFLGALLDEQEFNDSGYSEDRFAKAIDELFKPINVNYSRYNKKDSPFYLWEHLRCSMVHILRPESRIVFTGLDDANKLGYEHLQEIPWEDSKPQLLLVIEQFHTDLKEACRRVKYLVERKTHPKLKKGYITVTQFTHTFYYDEEEELIFRNGSQLYFETPTLSGGPMINCDFSQMPPEVKPVTGE